MKKNVLVILLLLSAERGFAAAIAKPAPVLKPLPVSIAGKYEGIVKSAIDSKVLGEISLGLVEASMAEPSADGKTILLKTVYNGSIETSGIAKSHLQFSGATYDASTGQLDASIQLPNFADLSGSSLKMIRLTGNLRNSQFVGVMYLDAFYQHGVFFTATLNAPPQEAVADANGLIAQELHALKKNYRSQSSQDATPACVGTTPVEDDKNLVYSLSFQKGIDEGTQELFYLLSPNISAVAILGIRYTNCSIGQPLTGQINEVFRESFIRSFAKGELELTAVSHKPGLGNSVLECTGTGSLQVIWNCTLTTPVATKTMQLQTVDPSFFLN